LLGGATDTWGTKAQLAQPAFPRRTATVRDVL